MSGDAERPWWLGPRMWLHYGALYFALRLAPLLSRLQRQSRPSQSSAIPVGVSLIIPERGTPDLLAETLRAAKASLQLVDEPSQLMVVVNGAPEADYADLVQKHADVEWIFESEALGYNGAVARGLAAARHGWSYLLNSDMRLDLRALLELLPHRAGNTFSLTSQIFFADPERRREETGLSDFIANADTPEVYERVPIDDVVLPCLYPGGGSSLLRTDVLRRYVADSRDYRPFYWEDADWGVQAWRDGWTVLFCPRSHAWHHHRATVTRYYEADEIDRIVRRNAFLFDLRHAWTGRSIYGVMAGIAAFDGATQRELTGNGLALRVLRSRSAALRARRDGIDYAHLEKLYPMPPPKRDKPLVLLVSPFALFPPSHGGARRVAELISRLSDRYDFILLSDEASLYDEHAREGLAQFRAVDLLEGRGDLIGEGPLSFRERMERHAWPRLISKLQQRIKNFRPDLVQIEFMELARLIENRLDAVPWTLSLHDVMIGVDGGETDSDQQALISRYDAVAVCSPEDAALLQRDDAQLVRNGATDRRGAYQPSPSAPPVLLFMGPLRYGPNRLGIEAFLDEVWPSLRREFSDIRLVILGGLGARQLVASDARYADMQVELADRYVDPTSYLAAATLTLNPLIDIRGSSLKLMESLLAGRVCVTTADGARGLGDDHPSAAEICANIADMAAPISRLIRDEAERHRRESPLDSRLGALTWTASAEAQAQLYQSLLAKKESAQ